MEKYCQYCSWFVTGNGDSCIKKEEELSSTYAKRTNKCGDFSLNPIDAYGENEKDYQQPREPRKKVGKHMGMFEKLDEDGQSKLVDALLCIISGILFYAFSKSLPEWMVGMMLVGAIVLSHCINKIW